MRRLVAHGRDITFNLDVFWRVNSLNLQPQKCRNVLIVVHGMLNLWFALNQTKHKLYKKCCNKPKDSKAFII